MKKKYTWRIVIAALAIMAALTMIFVAIAIMSPRPRSSKAQKYDLNCVTELKKNPLQECKHE